MRFWNWKIWKWPHWRTTLEVFERLVVIVGVGLAVFPLWQWYSEREERRIERVVNFAIAGDVCQDHVGPSTSVHLDLTAILEDQEMIDNLLHDVAADQRLAMFIFCLELHRYMRRDEVVNELRSYLIETYGLIVPVQPELEKTN